MTLNHIHVEKTHMRKTLKKIWKKYRNMLKNVFSEVSAPYYATKTIPLLIISVLIILIIPQIASAAVATASEAKEDLVVKMATKLSIIMQYISMVMWPILILIGDLLDNTAILSGKILEPVEGGAQPDITMEDHLLGIWVQIRNIVNIIFVVILLFVAIYNVLGISGDQFALKSMLPRIVIGLVAINFSFLACKVILDVTNVLTNALVAIPINLTGDYEKDVKEPMRKSMCTYLPPGETDESKRVNLTEAQIDNWGLTSICEKDESGNFTEKFNEYVENFSHRNILVIIGAQIAELSKLKYVNIAIQQNTEGTTPAKTADTIIDFLLETISNISFIIIYFVSMLAMLFVAMARIAVLWTLIAVSPLLILFMVIPQLTQGVEEFDFKKSFIQHAIAPIIMVGSLSIGYILLSSMANLQFNIDLLNDDIVEIAPIWAPFNRIGNVLATFGGVAIIWMGVFGAASKTYASFITDKIRDVTKAGAQWVGKLPIYATTILVTSMEPGKGKVDVSLGTAASMLSDIPQALERKFTGLDTKRQKAKALGIDKFLYGGSGDSMDRLMRAESEMDVRDNIKGAFEGEVSPAQWPTIAEKLSKIYEQKWGKRQKTKEEVLNFLKDKGSEVGLNFTDEELKNLKDNDTLKPQLSVEQQLKDSTTPQDALRVVAKNNVTSATLPAGHTNTAVNALLTELKKSSDPTKTAEQLASLLRDHPEAKQTAIIDAIVNSKANLPQVFEDPAQMQKFVEAVQAAGDVTSTFFVTEETVKETQSKKKAAVEEIRNKIASQ